MDHSGKILSNIVQLFKNIIPIFYGIRIWETIKSRENSINWAIFSLPKSFVPKNYLKDGYLALFWVQKFLEAHESLGKPSDA